jgi:hypothetical protein
MPNLKSAALLGDLRGLVTDEGFAISILAAVAAAAILAFGFGATAEIVALMLVIGVVTALAETKIRSSKKL